MPGEPITRRGRASRERIVERAAGLFAERGIAATSVDEVLEAAGAGKGQFYHYFRGRDELAAAAVGYRCAQVLAGLTRALGGVSSLAGLEQALAGFVSGFEQAGMPGCPIGTLATEVAGRNEAARLEAAAGFDAWERLLADALERMRQRGELRADAAPGVLATGLLAGIEGGMVLGQARQDMASLRIAVDAGLAQVRAYLSLVCTKRSTSRSLRTVLTGPVLEACLVTARSASLLATRHGKLLLLCAMRFPDVGPRPPATRFSYRNRTGNPRPRHRTSETLLMRAPVMRPPGSRRPSPKPKSSSQHR